jgi:2-polyprenyl-3-methyl-5-hydroxy-6-metoxy-1,4-benzoquinol methylase
MQQKPTPYFQSINTPLLDIMPTDAGVVLEIGCASGALGAAYKRRYPDCRIYGVEIDPKSAAEAAERLDAVLCGAVESMDLNFLQGRVDCLVYGDVLEHLVDPWAVLASQVALLRPGGKVCACIPNVQYWAVLECLMLGDWTYRDHGIMDETHLRFFTLKSVMTMFAAAGLHIDKVVGLNQERAPFLQFCDKIRPALRSFGIDEKLYFEHAEPLQFIVSASLAEPDGGVDDK